LNTGETADIITRGFGDIRQSPLTNGKTLKGTRTTTITITHQSFIYTMTTYTLT